MAEHLATVRTPFPHQQKVLEWARSRHKIGLFLSMRLGKSMVAIRWQRLQPMQGPDSHILVICPKQVIEVWEEELAMEGMPCTVLRPPMDERLTALQESPHKWFIVNPEGLFVPGQKYPSGRRKIVPSPIAMLPWHTVIVDESTLIKNPKAQITKVCLQCFNAVPFKAILSGLPNPESTLDFYCQMAFLSTYGEFMGYHNYWSFRKHLFTPGWTGYDWTPMKGMSERIRAAVGERTIFMTRKEAGFVENKVFERRYVDLPTPTQKKYGKIERDFALSLDDTTKFSVVKQTWLLRVAGGVFPDHPELSHNRKIDEMLSLFKGELKGQRAVIWFRFNDELYKAEEAIRKAGYRTAHITGLTPLEDRAERKIRFNTGKIDYLCMQIKCGRFGINLSAASVAILYSLPDSNEQFAQLQDRIVHMAKEGPLLYLYLLSRDTIDEDRYLALQVKGLTAKSFNQKVLQNLKKRVAARVAMR